MSPQRRLASRLLRASSSEVGKILREELGDADLFAAHFLDKADWDGPDILVHGTRGAYTVEVSNEPFRILNLAIEDAPLEERGSRIVRISNIKMRWVTEAVRMRQDTLRRVAEGFLGLQSAVPERYGDFFKPVSVRQLAEGTYLHETTVQSGVANKVIAIGGQRIQFDSFVTNVSR